LTEAQALYRADGYQEVKPFNAEPYAHHWFEKRLWTAPVPASSLLEGSGMRLATITYSTPNLVGGGYWLAEHVLEGTHKHWMSRLALGKREKIINSVALRSFGSEAVHMRASMHPGVFNVEPWSIRIENQVPPVPYVLHRTICREG
jgi:hypothetical protein